MGECLTETEQQRIRRVMEDMRQVERAARILLLMEVKDIRVLDTYAQNLYSHAAKVMAHTLAVAMSIEERAGADRRNDHTPEPGPSVGAGPAAHPPADRP